MFRNFVFNFIIIITIDNSEDFLQLPNYCSRIDNKDCVFINKWH